MSITSHVGRHLVDPQRGGCDDSVMTKEIVRRALRGLRQNMNAVLPALVLLTSCAATKPEALQAPAPPDAETKVGTPKETTIKVHFGTNRAELTPAKENPLRLFTSTNSGTLHYGTINVTIDANHVPGELDKSIQLRERHQILDEKQYLENLRRDLKRGTDKKLLVFVHGYNVTFENAARRTAQLKHDLEFGGEAAFFSWPSRGSLLGYWTDEKAVIEAEPFLKEYLTKLVNESKADQIYIIAHSMGNRAFTSVFPSVPLSVNRKQIVKEVLLAAPDIDAAIFANEIAPAMASRSCTTTLYCSDKDKALWGSWLVHGFKPRAGQRVCVHPDIESVDASTVDTRVLGLGHSYYAEQVNLLTDIQGVFGGRRPPQRTETLQPSHKTPEAWLLRKKLAQQAVAR